MPEFLKVEDVLSNLTINKAMSAVEFGCGSADFAIALARKLTKGKVYALDIQEEKLSFLSHKSGIEKIANICLVLCDVEKPYGSTLENNSLDIVLIPNILFQSENKYAILEEGKRILKPGGQFLVIDWLSCVPFGPKEKLVSPEEVKKIMSELGFNLKKEFATGDYHYGLLFIKNNDDT